MTNPPRITVAPNGARLQKSQHNAVPLSPCELAQTAASCTRAGADGLHLHVRDENGSHSLDPQRYRDAISAIKQAAPDLSIQITTEAAGLYGVGEQLRLITDLTPNAASIALREMNSDPVVAREVYAAAQSTGCEVQHILYGQSCIDQLGVWYADGIVPPHMKSAIAVLGQYDPQRPGKPDDLLPFLKARETHKLSLTVCAFGPQEQACLLAAARHGCALRVGFENNLVAPDGSLWPDNAAAVSALIAALEAEYTETAQ